MSALKLSPNKKRVPAKEESASLERDQAAFHHFDCDSRTPPSAVESENKRWSAGNFRTWEPKLLTWRPAGILVMFITFAMTSGWALQGVNIFPSGHKALPSTPTTISAKNDACIINKTYKINFYGPNDSQLQREYNSIVNELEINCLTINWNGLGHFRETDRTVAIFYSEGARSKAQDVVSIIRKTFRNSKSTTKTMLRDDRFTFDNNFKGNSRIVSVVYAPYRWLKKN